MGAGNGHSFSARWGEKSAKAHQACMTALAAVGDTAETFPTLLKPATGRNADRKVTFTALLQQKCKGREEVCESLDVYEAS